jgi:hypothetical protein
MKNSLPAVVMAALLGSCGLLAADSAPPVLTSFSVSPAAVDISTGDATVQVTLHLTDDESGFNYANLYLYNAKGAFVHNFFFRDIDVEPGGSATDGTYVIDVVVPRYGADGDWKFAGSFNDNASRQSNYGGSDLPFPVPGSEIFDVTNTGVEDIASPQLVSVNITPGTVDVTSQDQTITATLRITDDLSGLRNGFAILYNPSGTDSGIYSFFAGSLGVGTPQDGTYTVSLTIPRGSVAGQWEIRPQLRDRVGNFVYNIAGAPGATFTVANNGNLPTGGLGDACDATQYNWTTSGDEDWIFQSATTHDGIDAARSGPIGPDGSSEMALNVTGPGTLTFWWKVDSESFADELMVYTPGSGDSDSISGNVGWTEVTLDIAPGPQTVRWTYSKDSSGSSGEDAGWVDQVYFAADSDSELPTLQYIDITPDPASVASGEVEVTVTFEVSDDFNGVAGGYVDLYDPSEYSYDSVYFDSADRVSGDDSFGTYQVVFTIFQSDFPPFGSYQPGTWSAGVSVAENLTGDTRTYGPGSDAFPNPGAETFSVTGESSGELGISAINSFTPDPVDVTTASQTVTLDFTLDDPNGVFSYGNVYVYDGSNRFIDSIFFDSSDGSDNQYSVDLAISRYSAPGTWTVSFWLVDQDGNETDVSGGIPNPGDDAFTVINTDIVDVTPPLLSSIAITPATLDTSAAPGNLSITVSVAEDLSGIDYAYLEFIDPAGTTVSSLFKFVYPHMIVDGSFTVNQTLPQGSQPGVWRCEVGTKDMVGNFRKYGPDAFETPFPVPADAQFTIGPVADSTYAAFASAYGLTGPAALPGANPDSDWANNALELVLGLDPTLANTPDPAFYQVVRVGNELRLDFKVAAGLTVTDNGDFLDLTNVGGGPPLRVTGQTCPGLSGPWTNTRPLPVGGGVYRVTLPLGPGARGFCRLMFLDP